MFVVALVAFGGDALANPQAARALFKKGIDEYKQKKFGEASITLLKSYELDPRPDTLFALAQAERFDGRCTDAVEHYKKLLEQTTDLPTAKAVQFNIELCAPKPEDKPVEPVDKPVDPPVVDKPVDPPVVPPTPAPVTRTVVRTERSLDKLTAITLSSGTLALGGAVGFYLAARSNDSDSKTAVTLVESNRLYERSKDQRFVAYVSAAVGVGLVTTGIVRILRNKPRKTEVAAIPTRGGATFWVSATW
jgi:tetratricopeptide (TPR) repeat protein